jgi:heme exporter protein C
MMTASTGRRLKILKIYSGLAAIGAVIGLYLALAYAGTDVYQGQVQRIFYVHLPSYFGAFVAFSATVVGGVVYLATRRTKWDILAASAVEIGFALSLINLVLGSIWARPTWNTWWTGDPRMMTSAIMMLICLAYLLVRLGIENPKWRRLIASVLGIVLMGAMVVTLFVTRIRADTIHPVVIGSSPQNARGGFSMTDTMTLTLIVNLFVWGFLITPVLIWWRIRLENIAVRVEAAHRNDLMNTG